MNLNIFERVFFLLSFGSGTKYLKIHVSRLGEFERECRFDRNFWSKLSQLFQTTCIRTRFFDLRQCLCFASLPLCPPGVPRLIFWKPQLYNENVTDIKQTRSRRTWIKSDNCGKEKKIHPKRHPNRLKIRKVRSHQREDKELKFSSDIKTALGE